MSYSSQVYTINTPDVSAGFIEFLANGEFDEMLSNTPRRTYYNNLLNQGENISVDETRNDVKHVSDNCVNQQQTTGIKGLHTDPITYQLKDGSDNIILG
ncbi:Uncharacterized protein FWK35_00034885, partial [Aphis craccivora]